MPGVVMVSSRANGTEAIARQGHVRLPARVRHACRLGCGDRLLMAAYPDRDLLLIYTMAALDMMVLAHATAMPAAA